ncbi:flagellar hook-basal body complex protein [Paeniclostridium sordellii]|uniref:flagellar hook-basal body protein n=1 Tax=Paraclostridium sordellii TaxID=1505 RepID=UPI0005E4BBF8|nr:flagellar hook-basal body complex protein [Paeniclostridium sordellii]MBX9181167.1 flagellar hook-basal body complex protein [Paeniclostridium sordellii]MVO74740.1 flagellar hook-basal body complex protein [Paeniclostridium sordellii]CEO13993.1 flagellar hook protein FlgE (Distal rod protein) [[Clostridium] sordellii] [Paeniclostridium sordellii]CEP82781.1 flagellar hook protein FlgE (Distal rod protein) [[Clostridium] sordellii] [Paeniclostridium sordellii]CEQ17363.1 flagellar hook protein
MLKSMYSGISGMKANQTKMDVVGNNVANVGTTGFKKSTTRFADALNQTVIYSSVPGGDAGDPNVIGGVNPGQVGVGTKVNGIFRSMAQGNIQPTGRPTDLAIDGDGFFIVSVGTNQRAYTRDGSFTLDANGSLVTGDGYKVMGIDAGGNEKPIQIPKEEKNPAGVLQKVLSFNISKEGKISYLLADGTKVENAQTLKIAVFQNPEGLESLSGNLYGQTGNSGAPMNTKHGLINQGAIEMSNVDLSDEFTEMIVTTRAFQAASKVITTSDELLQEIINLKR